MTAPAQNPDPGTLDADALLHYLGRQIGGLSVQLAMREVRNEELERRVAELEQEVQGLRQRAGVQAEPPAPPAEETPEPPLPPGRQRSAVAEANAR